jgi:hypothetical protein
VSRKAPAVGVRVRVPRYFIGALPVQRLQDDEKIEGTDELTVKVVLGFRAIVLLTVLLIHIFYVYSGPVIEACRFIYGSL